MSLTELASAAHGSSNLGTWPPSGSRTLSVLSIHGQLDTWACGRVFGFPLRSEEGSSPAANQLSLHWDAPQSLQDSIWRVLMLETCPHRRRRYTYGRKLPWKPHVSGISSQKYSSAEESDAYSVRLGTRSRADELIRERSCAKDQAISTRARLPCCAAPEA